MSWLTQLSSHRMFSLPLQDAAAPTNNALEIVDSNSTSKLPSIFPVSSSTSTPIKNKSTPTSSPLPRHNNKRLPLNVNNTQSNIRQEEEILVEECKRNERMCLIRGGTELIVAVGRELRVCNLKEVKSRSSPTSQYNRTDEIDLGEYKVLDTGNSINFDIQQIVVNQTFKLLAVVGNHSLRVIELPRKTTTITSSTSNKIQVRCLEIGKFYHSLPGSPSIVKICWHPLGQHSSSLLVLTSTAAAAPRDRGRGSSSKLFEYTLHESSQEPSQIIDFFPSSSSDSKGGGFSAEDSDGARELTGMCFGDTFQQERQEEEGAADWGKMTIYGLFKNGDVRSICPFLPKRTTISKKYLQNLTSFVSTKLDYLSSSATTSSTIVTSSSSSSKSPLSRSSDHPESLSSSISIFESEKLEKRYSLQLQYLQTLLRQIPPLEEEDYVNVNAPISRPNLNPSIQGPYLFLPETIELVSNNGSIDSFASDLTYLSVKSSGSCCSCLGVLMIVYSDGKLEVLLEVEKPEARFKGEEINNSSNSLVVRTPRGKSILEEEEIQEEEEELPIFIVHETLDLGYSTECSSSSKEEELDRGKNWPIFKKDSLYEQENDLVWIYSKLGVQGLVLGKRIENVWDEVVNEKGEEEEKEEEVDDDVGESQVYWVIKTRSTTTTTTTTTSIVGLEIISDVYLGYSMIALTPLLQLVGVELNLRVKDSTNDDDDDKNDDHTIVKNEQGGGKKSYVSLLDTPFTLPTVFSSNKSSLSPPPLRIDSNPLENVTPNSLRLLGKQVETYQTLIRDLVEGVDSVQHRLELQLRELSRQLQNLKDLRDLISSSNEKKEEEEEGGGGGASGLVERMNRVEENQLKLLERLDKTLQVLMEKHQGNDRLSSYEKKWFEELKRVEKLLRGGNGQGGLEGKAKRVQAMWQELKPGVEEIVRKKTLLLEESSRSVVPLGGGLGKSQIQGLESKLSQEAKLLADARKKVERLSNSLAATSI